RAAFLRASRRERTPGTGLDAVAPLAALIRQTITGDLASETALDQHADRVLVVHARDDHHVPVDYAIAAAHRHPGWTLEVLDHGGHHAHISAPEAWSAPVTRWLTSRALP